METHPQQEPLKVKKGLNTTTQEPVSADLPIPVPSVEAQKAVVEAEEALGDAGRRKEYREALSRAGINMEFLVANLKNIAIAGEKDSDKIKALQVLLKSLGVDKSVAKEEDEGSGSWEEALVDDDTPKDEADYTVIEPEVPEHARKKRAEEDALGKSIYE